MSLRRLGFYALFILLLFACTKADTMRPSIEKSLLVIDSLTQKQPEKALLKLDSLLQNTKQLTTLEEAMLLFNKGEALYLNDKFQESLTTHLKCNELFAELNDTYNESRSLITLSGASLHMGDVETSQVYALKALSLAQLIGDKRIEGKAYNQLFKLHFQLKDFCLYLQVTHQKILNILQWMGRHYEIDRNHYLDHE